MTPISVQVSQASKAKKPLSEFGLECACFYESVHGVPGFVLGCLGSVSETRKSCLQECVSDCHWYISVMPSFGQPHSPNLEADDIYWGCSLCNKYSMNT